MNIHIKDETQLELFPDSKQSEIRRVHYQIKDLTLSAENIIVFGIVLLVTFVVFFSFGVERGKKVVSAAETVSENAVYQETQAIVEAGSVAVASSAVKEEVSETVLPVNAVAVTENLPVKTAAVRNAIPEKTPSVTQKKTEQKTKGQIYTIQVASYKQKSRAVKEADTLRKFGKETFVMTKGDYSIVCVGKFKEESDAKKFISKFKNKYGDCLVRRL